MTQVRPYQPSDENAVMNLAPRLTEGVASWRDVSRVCTAVQAWVQNSIAQVGRGDAALLVAEADGKVAGFVSVSEREHWSGERDAYIGELVVRADVEGRGIGATLVDAASTWARQRELANLTLETGTANTRARAFYGRLGFVEEDVRLALPLR